ncbi:MAG: hypothetical protein J6A25_12845 [Lachnospiraceae bacterium]|nr:hypothetical protein [Lachnospiraceae bacterium]
MNFKKTKRIAKTLLVAFAFVIVCGCGIVANGAARNGTYCYVMGSYTSDGSGTVAMTAVGNNKTTTTKMMTVSLKAYHPNGALYDEARVSLNTAAGETKTRNLWKVPVTCSGYAQTTIYAGTSISTAELENLTIQFK